MHATFEQAVVHIIGLWLGGLITADEAVDKIVLASVDHKIILSTITSP